MGFSGSERGGSKRRRGGVLVKRRPNRKDDRPVKDRDSLQQRLVAAYAADVEAVLTRSEEAPGDAAALLARCEQAGRQVTRALYEAASERAARREARPSCPTCGQPMARHVRWARPVLSVAGAWRGVFQRFRCERCGHGACPSHDHWLRFSCTPALCAAALGCAARVAFETAERQLASFGVHLSDNTLQRLMHEVGGEREAAARAEARTVLEEHVEVPAISAPRRLYIQADGRSAKVDGKWINVYVGVFFETSAEPLGDDQRKPRPERVSLVAHRDFATFGALLTAEAQRRGVYAAGEVVLIGDGGNWVWPLLEGLVPNNRRFTAILDWYHLKENLAKAVRAVWGEGFNDLAYKRVTDSAWVGDSGQVLAQLEQWRRQVSGEDAEREVAQVIHYVQAHAGRMNYQMLDLDGYQVGSGNVESRCKQLGLRIKGAGMDWSERGLNAVLTVLADELTDPGVRRELAA